jgi:hypothetical protein
MAAKKISVKKYVVRLSGEERERLETLIRKGKSPVRRVLKARILLKADVSEAGKGWSDNRIIDALETSPSAMAVETTAPNQVERAVDQPDMTIGLRKIAEHAAMGLIQVTPIAARDMNDGANCTRRSCEPQ